MNNIIAIVVAVLVVLGGAYYLLGNNSVQSPTAETASSAEEVAVSIQNFAFSPATLTVKTGTKVKWTNNDSSLHTITSDSGLFDSLSIAPGQSFRFTFSAPGTVSYHCSTHPSMKGTVIVTN